jgi:hypothetical protein
VTADPKPAARIVDRLATTRACLRWRECLVCGGPSATGHHVLARGAGGDDVLENITPLCGSGTTGCHGLVEARDPDALAALGDAILRCRPDVLDYLAAKIPQAASWFERNLPPVVR